MTKPFTARAHIIAAATMSVVCALVLHASSARAAPSEDARGEAVGLEDDIQSLAKIGTGSAGEVGVAVWRLDGSGPVALVNADDRFPMASTFKVAVAGAVLKRVEEGQTSLDQMVPIPLEAMIDSEVVQERFIHPGVSLSVYNLLELMLTASDNTAADIMLRLAGGPTAVTAWVRAQGVENLIVDGGTEEMFRRYYGLSADAEPFHDALAAKLAADPAMAKLSGMPHPAFDGDGRDTSTPRAMARLLTRIFSGKALSPTSTQILVGMMDRCRTGAHRLRGEIPPDTRLAHKTGTLGGSVNDVGVITLPGGAGQVVVAVFIKATDAPSDQREKAIAEIGRSVRDYFLFNAGGKSR